MSRNARLASVVAVARAVPAEVGLIRHPGVGWLGHAATAALAIGSSIAARVMPQL